MWSRHQDCSTHPQGYYRSLSMERDFNVSSFYSPSLLGQVQYVARSILSCMVTPGLHKRLWHIYLACALSARLSSSRHRHFYFWLESLQSSSEGGVPAHTVCQLLLIRVFVPDLRTSCLVWQPNLVQQLVLVGRSCAWSGAVEFLEISMQLRGAP